MAYSTARMEYAPSATYGNVAYDLNRVRRPAEAEIPVEAPQVETRVKVVPETRTAVRSAQAISPLAVIGFALAAVMIVLVLLSYVRLTEVTAETMELKAQLSALQAQEHELTIQYKNTFNKDSVMEYAIGTLGMVELDADQAMYLDAARQDRAVVLSGASGEASETDGLVSFVMSLVAYLR